MLNIEDIKLLNELFREVEVDSKYSVLKCKIELVCEQIAISEETQSKMASIQDKINELNKDGE